MSEDRRKAMMDELAKIKDSIQWMEKGFQYQESTNGIAECLKCRKSIEMLEAMVYTVDKKQPKCFGNIGENPDWLKEKFGIEKDYCHKKCLFRRECLKAY